MRSEIQKKVDGISGLTEVNYKIDNSTGKIVETGQLRRSLDPEKIEQGLPEYKQHLADLQSQIDQAKAQLKEIVNIEETEELKKFLVLQQNTAKLMQKKTVEATIAKKEEELQFHHDTYMEQTRLVNDWREWKKKFREKKQGGI